LGLGLSICRDVLEMHGGKFTIQSTNPHGCLVQLCLPFQAVPSLSKNVTSTPNAAKDTIKGTRNE
ncbi:ATP-binding protein, partial [Streptomyces sp. P9(2023)]